MTARRQGYRNKVDTGRGYHEGDAEAPVDLKERGLTQRDALLEVCDRAEVWRSFDGETFATILVDDHIEHHATGSNPFRDWMLGELARGYTVRGRPVSAGETAVRDARMALEAKAHVNRIRLHAPLRVSQSEGAVYIDLGSDDWSVIEATAEGWRRIPKSPVPIIRRKRTAAFPVPTGKERHARLRQLLAHLPEDDFILFVAWCLGRTHAAGALSDSHPER